MRKGFYALIGGLASSLLLVLIFYFLSAGRGIYSPVDIAGGMIYVFTLSIIVSASIWRGIIEKMIGG